ncbi:MAG: DUF1887 family protein [Bacteroidales bacterium]|jgi:hypothetical protein|nr:DUF1887 family protein [Bacteroidales bacterium]
MRYLIVTLLSDKKTNQNVQFIKYIQENKCKADQTKHWFISTSAMAKKGVGKWIRKVCEIPDENLILSIVHSSEIWDIEKTLKERSIANFFDKYDQIFVNITGGTNVMAIAVFNFFKTIRNANIYCIDDDKCRLVFPKKDEILAENINLQEADNISLQEYVEGHGFELTEEWSSDIDTDYTKQFFLKFVNFGEKERKILDELRRRGSQHFTSKFSKTKSIGLNEVVYLEKFLDQIEFPRKSVTIDIDECYYLTGRWFDEYIYIRLKEEGIIKGENIKKNVKLKEKGTENQNEYDVIFLHQTKFYAIEGKSYVSQRDEIFDKAIYKAAALQSNLGILSKFYIFTLTPRESDNVTDHLMNMAKFLNTNIFWREDIINCKSISELLGLKK